ncbi:MAG TPA: MBL fold metallo-hydrolase [Gammaproteobacteria bacterium]|nr:MBL fold metallo-hydrolase [Gammaproteobacteria bacterium]
MSRSTRTRPADRISLSRRRLLGAAVGAVPAASALSIGGTLIGTGGGLLPASGARAQPAPAAITTINFGGLVLLQGAGCNVIAMAGDDGALMVDGGLAANADVLLRAIYEATGNDRVAMLINTHWHPEQTGANEAVGNAGGTIFAHENTRIYLGNKVYADPFEPPREPLPEAARPTETTLGDGSLEFSGLRLDYGHLPQAHTDGDLYVHFLEHDVLVAGGVVSAERWPLLDYRNGAWYGGRVRALQRLAEVVEPDTRVVPAHGPPRSGRDVVRLRDIYDELFLTLIGYMNKGFGPEDAAAANPLAQYEDEFGDASEFLYGAYRSMLIAYVPE